MDKQQRKQLVQSYQEREREMGVYAITNKINGKQMIGASANLEGSWNRDKFGLQMGSHENKELQADWNRYGADAFVFEVLEKFKTDEKLTFAYDDVLHPDVAAQGAAKMRGYRKAAAKQAEIWIEKMNSYSPNGYNER
ncbi:hypothetical protein FHS18_002120 [Paenibacillus phyllosphaerae]|uniref:GIY-YIG nuclease family protein n=1 Tax=Paenibacillus phyllosphaerae TaxID=274593 RepID=A0A7W5FME6_9BACL|nr:GIY-YIG nuclease family protein [Paenibacillus phyllosphaerae]MBB3110053.1 hypothetical protein [Paenibacillus phyllosphaerae]